MRVLHIKEQFSRCIRRPICPEGLCRDDKFKIILVTCAAFPCSFRDHIQIVEHCHDCVIRAFNGYRITHGRRRQRLTLFIPYRETGSQHIPARRKLLCIIAAAQHVLFFAVSIQRYSVQSIDNGRSTLPVDQLLQRFRPCGIIRCPVCQDIVGIIFLQICDRLLIHVNLCLMAVHNPNPLQTVQRRYLCDQIFLQGIAVRIIPSDILFTCRFIDLKVCKCQGRQILFHIKSGILRIKDAHQRKSQRQGTNDRDGTLPVASQVRPGQCVKACTSTAPFRGPFCPLHIIIAQRFHGRYFSRHSRRPHAGNPDGDPGKQR